MYEVNRKIIDLSEPLLTEEAKQELDEIYDAPIDPEGRHINNVYNIPVEKQFNNLDKIIQKHGMSLLQNVTFFGDLFGMYNRVMTKEKQYFERNS